MCVCALFSGSGSVCAPGTFSFASAKRQPGHTVLSQNSVLVLFVGRAAGSGLTLLEHLPVDRGVRQEVLQTFQLPHDEDALRPWARVGDIKMVSALFRREFCARLVRDDSAEGGVLALEFAVFARPVEDIRFLAITLCLSQ